MGIRECAVELSVELSHHYNLFLNFFQAVLSFKELILKQKGNFQINIKILTVKIKTFFFSKDGFI